MHHETPSAAHYLQRNLANSNVTTLNEFQISQYQVDRFSASLTLVECLWNVTSVYPSITMHWIMKFTVLQICLWTGVGMVLLILSSVCCIVQMEVIPDSLLYAKFQSTRTHKNDWVVDINYFTFDLMPSHVSLDYNFEKAGKVWMEDPAPDHMSA